MKNLASLCHNMVSFTNAVTGFVFSQIIYFSLEMMHYKILKNLLFSINKASVISPLLL